MTYEVQTYTLSYGWINIWTEDDTPLTFDTLEDAQKALQEHLDDLAHAVQTGNMDDYTPEDYQIERIVP
jgi:hypothetical protein